MAKYLVYIETVGDALTPEGAVARVPTLPGASVHGQTIDEAKQKIREAVESYLRLLREAGEPVSRVGDGVQLEFEETRHTTYHSDYSPVSLDEMDMLLRWLAISRQELVDLVKDLPAGTLNWKADTKSASINEILGRIADAELWYTDRLRQWPESALFRLAAARGVALERLRALPQEKWSEVKIHEGEKWNLRKVIRRMLEFERAHIHQIRELLATQKEGA